MKIFHYHPETGALLGEGTADPSPLEPGEWLLPAHATAIEPLHPNNNEQVIWVNNNWQLRPIPEPEPPFEPEPTEPLPPPPSYTAEAAIQASMSAVFSTGTFTEADAEEFTAALAAGHLDGIYALN